MGTPKHAPYCVICCVFVAGKKMARSSYLLVILAVGILGVSSADTEFPSLLTALGSKMSLADDYYDDDATDDAPPNHCCYPLVWQGRSFHMLSVAYHGRGGHGRKGPTVSKSVDQFYVDGSNRRLAGFKMAFKGHGRPMNISWIFKIGANRTGDYYIFNRVAKKCQHRVVRNVSWRRQCIPVNATLRGSFSLGPLGQLPVQSWSFGGRSRGSPEIEGDRHPHSRPRVVFGANILVEPKTCIPVLFHEHGFVYRGIDEQAEEHSNNIDIDDTGSLNDQDDDYENYARRRVPRPHPRPGCGVAFSGSAFFTDAQTRITVPTVFTVPSYCQKDTLHEEEELPTILERFIML